MLTDNESALQNLYKAFFTFKVPSKKGDFDQQRELFRLGTNGTDGDS